jgi:hypothetical protein
MFRITIALLGVLIAGAGIAQGKSSDYNEDYQREALEIFRDIIAMRTAEGHAMVPVMAEYLAQRFLDAGFDAEDVHVIPHNPAGHFDWRGSCRAGRSLPRQWTCQQEAGSPSCSHGCCRCGSLGLGA